MNEQQVQYKIHHGEVRCEMGGGRRIPDPSELQNTF